MCVCVCVRERERERERARERERVNKVGGFERGKDNKVKHQVIKGENEFGRRN